jgi:hypothetical protein
MKFGHDFKKVSTKLNLSKNANNKVYYSLVVFK